MRNLFIFLAGAVIGSAATYLLVKDKYEKIVEEEIESVKEEYSKTLEAKRKISELKEAKNEIAERILNNASRVGIGAFEERIEAPVNYNIFSKQPPEIEEEIDEQEEIAEYPKEGIAEVPYTISPELFVNDKKYFDKITLEYYEGNDMLVEEITNEPVDIDYAIGRDSLRMFGEFEKDLVYVRNERISTDYEVYHYSGSFNPD